MLDLPLSRFVVSVFVHLGHISVKRIVLRPDRPIEVLSISRKFDPVYSYCRSTIKYSIILISLGDDNMVGIKTQASPGGQGRIKNPSEVCKEKLRHVTQATTPAHPRKLSVRP